MRHLFAILLTAVLAFVLAACATPRPEQKTDYDRVRRDHQKASQDLGREEDQRDETQE